MFDRLGSFRLPVRLDDCDLGLRAAASGMRLLHDPETLALYRQRPGSLSDDLSEMLLAQREALVHLLDHAVLSPEDRSLTQQAIAHCGTVAGRAPLERRLRGGDLGHARRDLFRPAALYTPLRAPLVASLGGPTGRLGGGRGRQPRRPGADDDDVSHGHIR